MQIKILNYSWLRFNGIHLQRDGTLKSAQLTPTRHGRRFFLPAVEVVDPDLRELLATEILAAIHQHLETLPPEKRMRPPQPIVPRAQPGQREPETPVVALHAQPASAVPARPAILAPRKPLPPPRRLLANLVTKGGPDE
jgi:hypothetical protein